MSGNTRSKRQIESLLRIRDWHLTSALRAQSEGRCEEAQFHMHYYRLLGPAVTMGEASMAVNIESVVEHMPAD